MYDVLVSHGGGGVGVKDQLLEKTRKSQSGEIAGRQARKYPC